MKCPLCHKDTVQINEVEVPDGQYHYLDWLVVCVNCRLIRCNFAADNYYGRDYFATKEDVEKHWNELCSKYSPLA